MGIAFEKLPIQVQERIRRDNPAEFGALARLETTKPKRAALQTLVSRDPAFKGRPQSIGIRVNLIAVRRRLLDSDNLVASFKHCRDAIAAQLGLDDNDERIEWRCEQHKTKGREGVLVQIEATI